MVLFGTAAPLFCQRRSFNDIYPGVDKERQAEIFSAGGFSRTGEGSGGLLFPPGQARQDISAFILSRSPRYIGESIRVVPYGKKGGGLLKVYNALSRVEDLRYQTYPSSTKGKDIPLFVEATRIEGPGKNKALPDPGPSAILPASETNYLRLKDANFGNTYCQAQLSTKTQFLLYSLTNFKTLYYGIIPVMRENSFNAQLYVEPLTEGFLIYSAVGVDVSDFIARWIDIPSAIGKRVNVIVNWLAEGIGG
jgi:hypothetical protein